MLYCHECCFLGYCRKLETHIVTDAELKNHHFVRSVRETAFDEEVSDSDWHEHVNDLYRDFRGWVRSEDGFEVFLDMGEFERPSIREWFRDFCCTPCPPDVKPRVRLIARERARVLATILRATYPVRAAAWPTVPANDNRKPR